MAENLNKFKILREIANSDSPVTYQLLLNLFGDEMDKATIWRNLQLLILDGCIEEKNFKKEGMDAQDYRVSENVVGHVPKIFYLVTERGEKRLDITADYFNKRGAL
jgi:hypothetical protein